MAVALACERERFWRHVVGIKYGEGWGGRSMKEVIRPHSTWV